MCSCSKKNIENRNLLKYAWKSNCKRWKLINLFRINLDMISNCLKTITVSMHRLKEWKKQQKKKNWWCRNCKILWSNKDKHYQFFKMQCIKILSRRVKELIVCLMLTSLEVKLLVNFKIIKELQITPLCYEKFCFYILIKIIL